MPNTNGIEADLVELAGSRAYRRAIDYRERAAQLRKMAQAEAVDRVRDDLLRLAEEYDGLVARQVNPPPR